jgi:poly(A) polymerase
MAPLINNVPAARVFDEMLKLLMSGQALACLQQLRKEGLHHGLLPLLDVVLEQPLGVKFVTLALDSTDARITPARRFAGLPVCVAAVASGAGEVDRLPRRRRTDRFRRCTWRPTTCSIRKPKSWRCSARSVPTCATSGRCSRASSAAPARTPYKLLEHLRFRAGYDFLLLRCASGEIDPEIGEWWTAFYEGDEATAPKWYRLSALGGGAKRKRPPRGGVKKRCGSHRRCG